jgi:hypothetical protein
VEAGAFVPDGDIGQTVCGFDLKGFAEFHEEEGKVGGSGFEIGPSDKVAQSGSAVVAPGRWRFLHAANRANSARTPVSQLTRHLGQTVVWRRHGDGGYVMPKRLGKAEDLTPLPDRLELDEPV